MINSFVHLLGGSTLEHGGRVVRIGLGLGDGLGKTWLIALAMVLIPATYLSYLRTAGMISPARRWTLIGLGIPLFILLRAFLARPIMELTIQGTIRRPLVFLVDVSKSMSIQDNRQLDA